MSWRKLSKNEALEYLTPVIDGEVSEDIRIAFMEYLETDEEVRRYYLSQKRVKELISSRYLPRKAPDRLRRSVRNYIKTRKERDSEADDLNIDHRCQPVDRITPDVPDPREKASLWRVLGAAGMVGLLALLNLLLPGE